MSNVAIVMTEMELAAFVERRIAIALGREREPLPDTSEFVDVLAGYIPKRRLTTEVLESDELYAKRNDLLDRQGRQIRDVMTSWTLTAKHPREDEIRQRVQDLSVHSPGDVYFFKPTPGDMIKIGTSTNVPERLVALRDRGGMSKLECVAYSPGGAQFEKLLHHVFRESRESGEWFCVTSSLVSLIRLVVSTQWVWE